MNLSACSRRLSGSIRARALSMTASVGQPLGLRSSNTLSSLDIRGHDVLWTSESGGDNALDALGFISGATPTGICKQATFAALGRPPPVRAPRKAENDTASTPSRHPSAGPLWRPAALCSST
ncbi:hypothetical protein FKP32DRAFT_1542678, partial [Trametes sanguinea]